MGHIAERMRLRQRSANWKITSGNLPEERKAEEKKRKYKDKTYGAEKQN